MKPGRMPYFKKHGIRSIKIALLMLAAGLSACSTTRHNGNLMSEKGVPALYGATAEEDRTEDGGKEEEAGGPGEWAKLREAQRASEDGMVRPDGLAHATAQRRAILDSTPRGSGLHTTTAGIANDRWTSLGPGNIGGRIRSIVVHPEEPDTMWVGSVGGGIWNTADGGATWHAVNDFAGNLGVSSLVMDPADPNTMYAGTGEGFFCSDAARGYGVFKSTDGGYTWNHLFSTTPSNDTGCSSDYNWYHVNRLSISLNRVILAATRGYNGNCGGIYRSADGGATWTSSFTGRITDVLFDPNDPNNALANAINYNFETEQWESYILRSGDSGQSWTIVSTFAASDGRVELAYAKSDSRIAYAAYDDGSSRAGTIYKSADGGLTWTFMSKPGHMGAQGWYDNALWVSPADPDLVVVGGIDTWRSEDGGATWTQISISWKWPESAHEDHHVIVSHPGFDGINNKTVFFGNDGGIWKVDDITSAITLSGYDTNGRHVTSIPWKSLNSSLGITQFYSGAGSPDAAKVIGGTQDNGVLIYTGSETWRRSKGGDGGFVAIDPIDSNYIYGEYTYLGLYRSVDGGTTFQTICRGITEGNSSKNFCSGTEESLFIAPFILDPNNPDTLLAGAASLWRSADIKAAEPSWRVVKLPVTVNGTKIFISAIAVAPGNSDIIWVGYQNGYVYYTTNGTALNPVWTRVSGLPSRYVMRFLIDKDDNNRVYVALGGFDPDNLYTTSDYGGSWTDLSGNIPAAPIRSIVRHPVRADWLYAGTEVGIFASEDGGNTWSTTNSGPANVSVDELFWYGNDRLIAATHGRGMFMTTISANCAAVLSEDLYLHIPIMTYSGQSYWADLSYDADTQSFRVGTAGLVMDISPFSGCSPATLSHDSKLRIPEIIFDGQSFSADLQGSGGSEFTLEGKD